MDHIEHNNSMIQRNIRIIQKIITQKDAIKQNLCPDNRTMAYITLTGLPLHLMGRGASHHHEKMSIEVLDAMFLTPFTSIK